jgi:hypothetical protein
MSKADRRVVMAEPYIDVGLPGDFLGVLGSQLRIGYGKLVREPIPDKLLDLLRRLEAKEKAS